MVPRKFKVGLLWHLEVLSRQPVGSILPGRVPLGPADPVAACAMFSGPAGAEGGSTHRDEPWSVAAPPVLTRLVRRVLQALPQRWVFEGMYSLCGDPWRYRRSAQEARRYDDLLDLLRSVRKPEDWRESSILEVGCSVGAFTQRLLELDPREVIALDISATALARARSSVSSPRVSFLRRDIYADPPPSGCNFVVASDVLYYTEDAAVLATTRDRLLEALAPGGLILVAHTRLRAHDGAGFDSFPSGYPLIGASPIARCFLERCTAVASRLSEAWQADVFSPLPAAPVPGDVPVPMV